jgi:AcrR family transcriptional regulator
MTAKRSRGQRAGLTRAAILRAAVTLADREGLKAVSMRRLAAGLGVEAMTLYHHIPNKDDLLDGMVEQVVSTVIPPRWEDVPWDEGLRGYGRALRATLLSHPNLVPLLTSRPAVTPLNLRAMENALGALCSAGFTPGRALDVMYSLAGFVVGHVALATAAVPADGGHTAPGIDPDAHPLFHAAVHAGDREQSSRFDFALDSLITGFEAARVAPPRDPREPLADLP